MANWSVSPHFTHSNNGTFTFPKNTGSTDIKYTVSYTSDTNCTASTACTVPKCTSTKLKIGFDVYIDANSDGIYRVRVITQGPISQNDYDQLDENNALMNGTINGILSKTNDTISPYGLGFHMVKSDFTYISGMNMWSGSTSGSFSIPFSTNITDDDDCDCITNRYTCDYLAQKYESNGAVGYASNIEGNITIRYVEDGGNCIVAQK